MFFVNCNNLNTRPLWIPAFAERATLSKFSIYLSKTYYSHKQFHPPNHLLTQTIRSTQPPTHTSTHSFTHTPILPITYLHLRLSHPSIRHLLFQNLFTFTRDPFKPNGTSALEPSPNIITRSAIFARIWFALTPN